MAKVQLLAVLSLDGCLPDVSGEIRWWVRPERYGIENIRNEATSLLSENISLSVLTAWLQRKDDAVYLIEASPETTGFINSIMHMHLIDEIILYTVPLIAGNGRHLFKSALPLSYWGFISHKEYNGEIIRTIYHKKELSE